MRKATVLLPFLYLLPWGVQCLVNNFMPVYLASLPFATEKTVGYVMAFGSVVTMVTQPVWAKAADRSSNKSRVLMWSFICLAFFSILFINQKITQPLLYGMVFLFYSCYMVHQPLIDSIAVENENRLHCSFGAIRSFASLGYALAGLVFGIIDQGTSNGIFYYVAALALASAVLAGRMPPPETAIQKQRAAKAGVINKQFVLFLGYTFFLYIASSASPPSSRCIMQRS
ncbi:MAG: MFS transporter [Clostridia bacterium]|nr:MFS transporter [Clostridia bacterium]